ncbi:MAG: 23S rRNA (pseudouridine(1915)-N(3))-methyltransferase RlmH [Oligoflexia bacterium]|nr:23S rRNA (pseudouridine(1915)-N(3))-methyltransferase RlmH [Oligoflexia bacterium]
MSGKEIFVVAVGKLKDAHLRLLEEEYLKRIYSPRLVLSEIKSVQEDRERESQAVLIKIKELCSGRSPYLLLLSENGTCLDSNRFARKIFSLLEEKGQNQQIIFIIAGAHGPTSQLLSSANELISLSPLTLPHRLARLILIEQIYRAQTIHYGHPYHH